MANAAQKKLAAANAKTLQTHRYAFLAINATFILIRLFLRHASSTWTLYIMYLFSASLATWLQFQIEFVGRPKFDERGGVLDPGSDLAQLGMTEYMFDVLYLTWGIQLLVAFTTTWAWWLYSLIPLYAGMKAWEFWKGQRGAVHAEEEAPAKQTRSQKRAAARR